MSAHFVNKLDEKKNLYDNLYMDLAKRVAEMSYCVRKKVGAIIVKDGRIISHGWNGMPAKMDNCCETPDSKTKPEVIHAEENAIIKLTRCAENSVGASLYVTMGPCLPCAKMIYNSGIIEVYYIEEHIRHKDGIQYLIDRGIQITQMGYN